ncbi:NUCLEAR PORE COMPLEX PROTEIN NUP50 [Salix purpurea]|uniref:NUCLEAR PORE COMPLEX PROTEIN NUP50 n=1 Tax=Salix purpurea TaxID=77065 RepID=A0A9Q0TIS6_SALPP|nr:NUCLEAR PORE COMPLEX PROTEIN NUP50 [Salix purpurea]
MTPSGGPSSIPPNHNTADDENELQQPGSPSVKKSEEKGIVTVHEVKCKLYVKSSDPSDIDTWKDKGPGQLSIKCKEGIGRSTKESKPTIVVRNDVGKVLLNALLYPGIKTNPQKNSLVAIFHTAGDDSGNSDSVVARTFLIRTKTQEDRNNLATAIQEYAPTS